MRELVIAVATYLGLLAAQLALFTFVPEFSKHTMNLLAYFFVGSIPIYGSFLFMLLEKTIISKDIGQEAAEVFEAEWSVYFAAERPSVNERTAA